MGIKRRQGRPKRGHDEVGSSFILTSAREAMRASPFDLYSRKDLSNAVGVTPALISYYFPREVNMADLILSPIMHAHLQAIKQITSMELPSSDRSFRVAEYLIAALRYDKHIFEAYMAMIYRANAPHDNVIEEIQLVIRGLMEECDLFGVAGQYSRAVHHGAFWGMCVAAARLDPDFPAQRPFVNGNDQFGTARWRESDANCRNTSSA